MPVYKEKSGTWRVNYRFTDWTGANKQTTKRGFATRREAVAWEKEQSIKLKASLNMTFGSFVDLYTADMKCRYGKTPGSQRITSSGRRSCRISRIVKSGISIPETS